MSLHLLASTGHMHALAHGPLPSSSEIHHSILYHFCHVVFCLFDTSCMPFMRAFVIYIEVTRIIRDGLPISRFLITSQHVCQVPLDI